MKDFNKTIEYKGKQYKLVFNLNVMEEIQEKYKTLEKWADMTEGKTQEPNAQAVIFGFTAMINEGIDIDNEDTGGNDPHLTLKQVGRLITNVGLAQATQTLQETVVESTKSEEKNA